MSPTVKTQNFLFIVLALVGLFGVGFWITANAQSNVKQGDAPIIVGPAFDWANKPWNGDNSPYHNIRLEIDRLADKGNLTAISLENYRQAWIQKPRDPLILFRWAYADNLAKRRFPNLPPHMSPGDGAFEEPGLIDPYAYDYERIRFLLNWPGNEQVLLPLAKRLASRDPKDFAIQYQLAGLYSGRDTPAKKAASIARIKRLLVQYPNKPGLYSLLGGVYYAHWLENKDAGDAKKAIFYYKKYLQAIPPNTPWRNQAESIIKDIENPTSY